MLEISRDFFCALTWPIRAAQLLLYGILQSNCFVVVAMSGERFYSPVLHKSSVQYTSAIFMARCKFLELKS